MNWKDKVLGKAAYINEANEGSKISHMVKDLRARIDAFENTERIVYRKKIRKFLK